MEISNILVLAAAGGAFYMAYSIGVKGIEHETKDLLKHTNQALKQISGNRAVDIKVEDNLAMLQPIQDPGRYFQNYTSYSKSGILLRTESIDAKVRGAAVLDTVYHNRRYNSGRLGARDISNLY
jgi:hypothetical protein